MIKNQIRIIYDRLDNNIPYLGLTTNGKRSRKPKFKTCGKWGQSPEKCWINSDYKGKIPSFWKSEEDVSNNNGVTISMK